MGIAAQRLVQPLITGSRMQDVLSLAPWGCALRLWYELRGTPPDYAKEKPTGAMRRGTAGEALAAGEYSLVTGRKMRRHGPLEHASIPEFGGHMDRHIVAFDERGPGVLEIKCPGIWEFNRVKRNGLQEAYIAQLQWYMYLTHWRWGAYAIFNLDTWQLLHWDVERDDALIAELVRAAHEFLRAVENGPAPAKLDPKDRRCGRCQFRKSCQGEALVQLTGDGDKSDVAVDLALAPIAQEYKEWQETVAEAEDGLAEARARLEAALEGRSVVETTGARIYHRQQIAVRNDDEAIARAYPELAQRLAAEKKGIKDALAAKREPPKAELCKLQRSRPLRIFPI